MCVLLMFAIFYSRFHITNIMHFSNILHLFKYSLLIHQQINLVISDYTSVLIFVV